MIGVVYTTEKEYDMYHYGLKTFGRKVAGDYPRVGILGLGDTITSNCFQYDDTEFADEQDAAEASALYAALGEINTTPLYVKPVIGSPIAQITKTAPTTGVYAKVAKFYTVPNGEKGIKYQVVHL